MTLSWIALVACSVMALFNLTLAIVHSARHAMSIAIVYTIAGLICMGLAAVQVPFITGAWS